MSRKVKKIIIHEEDDGEGNWLISYADMMTLLFGFFVILSSMSTPNSELVEKMKKTTSESTGGVYTAPNKELKENLDSLVKNIPGTKVVSNEASVILTSTGSVFFESGSAELKPASRKFLNRISKILIQKKGYNIFIEGHSDNIPINTKKYPSNWELSSARACSVVRYFENKGIVSNRMRPLGLADTEPLFANTDKNGNDILENQKKNRRIVFKFVKRLGN